MVELPVEDESRLLPARLIEGYEVFLRGRFRREQDRYRELADHGQSPKVLLIGCCDSRVSPEVIFDADPGEIFVLRNIANLIPPYEPDSEHHGTSAALEYAVKVLKVAHIVVMGHAMCGGVRAYVETQSGEAVKLAPGDFIGQWISLLAPAARKLGPRTEPMADYAEKLGRAAIIDSLANLRTFPYVREAEQAGALALHGAYFGVADGRLLGLDEATGTFSPLAAKAHAAALGTPRF
ncbi:carbonic anhydrase [uncultured Methylovirgula sp.]|uniref:carbonic anhydrase n=1 Tax=uncultured Methylovirgula sp. TaxID=1285960 RepID=UPI00262F5473|nr:carbonic anhydrase [uncultured Methylovirgula sp.]